MGGTLASGISPARDLPRDTAIREGGGVGARSTSGPQNASRPEICGSLGSFSFSLSVL